MGACPDCRVMVTWLANEPTNNYNVNMRWSVARLADPQIKRVGVTHRQVTGVLALLTGVRMCPATLVRAEKRITVKCEPNLPGAGWRWSDAQISSSRRKAVVVTMQIDKERFMKLLRFPDEWKDLDIYSDDLFSRQLQCLLQDIGEEELVKRYERGTFGGGEEHYRAGASHWIIANEPDTSRLRGLRRALENDPDQRMGRALIEELDLLRVVRSP